MKRKLSISFLVFFFLGAGAVSAQKAKAPCEDVKIQLTSPDGADFTMAEVKKDATCLDGAFIRIIGIYRTFFENSDLYDPIDQSAKAWVDFDPFYAAVKRCGSPANLKTLNIKNGGTFGFIALGVVNTNGRFGHLSGWDSKFRPICIEKVQVLAKDGSGFQSQPELVRKKILDWYNREVRKLY